MEGSANTGGGDGPGETRETEAYRLLPEIIYFAISFTQREPKTMFSELMTIFSFLFVILVLSKYVKRSQGPKVKRPQGH